MLKNFFDFGKTKIVPTPDEILFFEFLEKNYGISAVETHFCKGKIQNSLHIWIDAEKTNKLSSNGILNSVDLRNGSFSLNCDPSNNELNDFAEEVINKYFSFFSIKDIAFTKTTTDINGNQIPKTALYIYDFNYYFKSYVYGHAINNIKKVISKKYKLSSWSIKNSTEKIPSNPISLNIFIHTLACRPTSPFAYAIIASSTSLKYEPSPISPSTTIVK